MDLSRLSEPAYLIGQIMGLVAVIMGFISLQMKDQKRLIALQTVVTITFSLHFFLIGAMTGFVMNLVGCFRNIAYYFRDRKFLSTPATPVFFALVMGGLGIWAWEGWYSLFMIVGLVVNSLCLTFRNTDNLRKSILITSPLVIVYDVFTSSYGGIIYETTAIVSSVIALVRHHVSEKKGSAEEK